MKAKIKAKQLALLVSLCCLIFTAKGEGFGEAPIHYRFTRTVFIPAGEENWTVASSNVVIVDAYLCDMQLAMWLYQGGKGADYLKEIIGYDKDGIWSRIEQKKYLAPLSGSQMDEKTAIFAKFLQFGEDLQTILSLEKITNTYTAKLAVQLGEAKASIYGSSKQSIAKRSTSRVGNEQFWFTTNYSISDGGPAQEGNVKIIAHSQKKTFLSKELIFQAVDTELHGDEQGNPCDLATAGFTNLPIVFSNGVMKQGDRIFPLDSKPNRNLVLTGFVVAFVLFTTMAFLWWKKNKQ